ncbi:6638_t:CDS:1 [Paraglomus brasilianum]|uniref:6638_t:CDS:1 n=1 Tax=Paraglomus brasilianum TaxID=144538 RepID=A0A9N8VQT5_9GLOM|nr:6638_t:CDS:1 [Paraglomus brasilianum]
MSSSSVNSGFDNDIPITRHSIKVQDLLDSPMEDEIRHPSRLSESRIETSRRVNNSARLFANPETKLPMSGSESVEWIKQDGLVEAVSDVFHAQEETEDQDAFEDSVLEEIEAQMRNLEERTRSKPSYFAVARPGAPAGFYGTGTFTPPEYISKWFNRPKVNPASTEERKQSKPRGRQRKAPGEPRKRAEKGKGRQTEDGPDGVKKQVRKKAVNAEPKPRKRARVNKDTDTKIAKPRKHVSVTESFGDPKDGDTGNHSHRPLSIKAQIKQRLLDRKRRKEREKANGKEGSSAASSASSRPSTPRKKLKDVTGLSSSISSLTSSPSSSDIEDSPIGHPGGSQSDFLNNNNNTTS